MLGLVVGIVKEAAMGSYRRITEQIITLLTLLVSILALLRQAEKIEIPFDPAGGRGPAQKVESVAPGQVADKVRTKLR
jgi:hypothetical protein